MQMIRVSELLNITANDLDRVVIMDHGNLYPFNNKTWHEMDKYSRRGVSCYYIESMYFESKDSEGGTIVKQTMFIELKGEQK